MLSHYVGHLVDKAEDIDMKDLRKQYENYDPRIKRIVDVIPKGQRWPLLVTGPLRSWSSPQKNVVLVGDAAHSMVNHMAQGAATAMEDGAFFGRCVSQVVKCYISLAQAIEIYERGRMTKAHFKQQASFLNGAIWHLPDGPAQQARDEVMKLELDGRPVLKSANLYGDPTTILSVYAYDAEEHADSAIFEYLGGRDPVDTVKSITKATADTFMNWFLPLEYERKQINIDAKL